MMNLTRCCSASCAHAARHHRGFCLAGCLSTIATQLSPQQRWSEADGVKPHKPRRAEQTGFTELLISQAPVPPTTIAAHLLSQGLWAGKYGFMCAHITFGSGDAFKSNYGKRYLHELLF